MEQKPPTSPADDSLTTQQRRGPRFQTTDYTLQLFIGDEAVVFTQGRNVNSIELLEPIHKQEDVHCVFRNGGRARSLKDLSESIARSRH